MRVGSSGAPNPAISEVSHAVRLPLAARWASGVPAQYRAVVAVGAPLARLRPYL